MYLSCLQPVDIVIEIFNEKDNVKGEEEEEEEEEEDDNDDDGQ